MKNGRIGLVLVGAVGIVGMSSVDWEGVARGMRATTTLARVAADYKWSLRKGAFGESQDYTQTDEYSQTRSLVHKRSAEKLLDLFRKNGGIYVKLGQHIASLVYLLPVEYTETMTVLQDKCDPSSIGEVKQLVLQDTGRSIGELFERFEENPMGVASLAQVHRAFIRIDGQSVCVAVKIQHPRLDRDASSDIRLCSFFVRLIKRIFPDFEFDWLAQELQSSLPRELDFDQEHCNAEKARRNFAGSGLVTIPTVHWSQRRILVMDFIDGCRIDNCEFIDSHGISRESVSQRLTKAYSEMIFKHGFVHCDPHPGNLMLKPIKCPSINNPIGWLRWFLRAVLFRTNFELVLLDHGLYRQLSDEFRLQYARFWRAIMESDEKTIQDSAYRLFLHSNNRRKSRDGIEYHRLFASMVSGRPWEVISSKSTGGIKTLRSRRETQLIQTNAGTNRFLLAMADILASIPTELLLLLKTNDLLRSVDASLGVASASTANHMTRMVSMMGVYCADAIYASEKRDGFMKLVAMQFEYWRIVLPLMILQLN